MTDKKLKFQLKVLEEDTDYALWKLRLESVLSDEGLSETIEHEAASESSAEATETDMREKEKLRKRAVAIIVTALGDKALRVVRTVSKDPSKMIDKLNERYNSKTTAAKISKMAELVSLHYKDRNEDISSHIDKMAGLIETIKGMNLPIDDTMAIGILVASIKVNKLAPVVAAIKTIPEADMKWDTVSARLIEDWKDLPKTIKTEEETSFTVRVMCNFCGRHGHTDKDCKFRKQFIKRQVYENDDDNDKHQQARSASARPVRYA